MHNIQTVAPDIIYVGASDRRLAKFENLFPIPRAFPTTPMSSWTKRPR